MKKEHLSGLLEQPEIHRRILSSYRGGYTLGVTADPRNNRESAIYLQIEGNDTEGIPTEIELDGEIIQIIVATDFTAPSAL